MLNRVRNLGLQREVPFLTLAESNQLRSEVDHYIEKKIQQWNETVPYAKHLDGAEVNRKYYKRHLIETALRIRLLRVAESKALAEIAKISPEAAQIWANYEREEMIHDELFVRDFEAAGGTRDELYSTEPYLSTKLLAGFFSYLLDHEGPLGVVAYSYLVETVNVKLDPKRVESLKKSLGSHLVKGYEAHNHTDENDDHPGEVWGALRYLLRSEADIKALYGYLDQNQRILAQYFEEIYRDTVVA